MFANVSRLNQCCLESTFSSSFHYIFLFLLLPLARSSLPLYLLSRFSTQGNQLLLVCILVHAIYCVHGICKLVSISLFVYRPDCCKWIILPRKFFRIFLMFWWLLWRRMFGIWCKLSVMGPFHWHCDQLSLATVISATAFPLPVQAEMDYLRTKGNLACLQCRHVSRLT